MDNVEIFKTELTQLINKSQLPASVVKLVLEYMAGQIEIALFRKNNIIKGEIKKEENV